MDQTIEKDNPLPERKDPNDEEGGIRRRLRDRDLLKKRKAEAEEKATNQAQSRRKRERREERSGTGKKGRPRKVNAASEALVPQEEIPPADVLPAPVVEVKPLPIFQALPQEYEEPKVPPAATTLPVPVLGLNPLPGPVFAPGPPSPAPAPAPALAPAPAPAPALAPASGFAFSPAVKASGSAEEVFIEDLGPDEEEDLPLPQGNLIIDQGTSEEPPADVPEQKTFSYPLFASPPPQQEYLPGNFI
ncbi:skin secretory protein xP2 isoform X2 [Sardina pilchardus]|uniref:skin secretory protein xP2 isoform X2 n=1 Tax=Sardina pilchardus TaxID=27697 RepID=UPI002E11A581